MRLIEVRVEYGAMALDRTFTYSTDSNTIQPGCRVWIEFNHKQIVGFVSQVDVENDRPDIKPILSIIDEAPLLNAELEALARQLAYDSVSSLISVYKAMLPPALKPQSAAAKVVMEDWFILGTPSGKLSAKAQAFLDAHKEALPMKASAFRALSKTLYKSMLKYGDIQVEKRRKQANLFAQPALVHSAPVLSLQQEQAIETMQSAQQQVCLLHGVTGSGKTEVFFAMAQKALDQHKQVLFLVPEIGLTPMMIARVRARFDVPVAIYHSRLSAQEKYDQYLQVKEGKVSIVIGTRSAVFMPFDNLGLILMDEEHDHSYKQDSTPRYHARDAALLRAQYHQCPLILASATPSLETFARAWKGIYALASMPKRVHENQTRIEMIDLRNERAESGLSLPLKEAIARRLEDHEQVIILLNRRGYYPTMRCLECKSVIMCPDCQIPMAYHKRENQLVCHVCGNRQHFSSVCPSCGGSHFASSGFGTERLEEELKHSFPEAHVVRMDADTTRSKHGHEKLLQEFEQHGDILIGTQMVAKGLDFPRVTLVGIIGADNALIRQDYRAAETAYELLEQASGRSGRSSQGGEVLIQSFDQDHFVMRAIRHHSYKEFYRQEMRFRHLGSYPPYVYMCTLVLMDAEYARAMQAAAWLKGRLHACKVVGPADISMRQKLYRVRLLVKDKNDAKLKESIWNAVRAYYENNMRPRLEINMHPVTLEE